MEEQAVTLLAALKKSSTAVDTKLVLFNNLKSNIKHLRVPEASQAPIFECIRLAIGASASTALASTGFSTLGHFIKRLVLQNQTTIITSQASRLLPLLLDRLGDVRESHRNASSQLLADLWPLCPSEVESLIRDTAMKGTNARAKEMSMLWVVKMNQSEGLPFRSFVPIIVANLEDSDGVVRETAKQAVVELFRNAPEHAKSDLKKQLATFNVRKTIASYIISHLSSSIPPEPDFSTSATSASATPAEPFKPNASLADSVLSEAPPPPEVVPMDPIYVHTQRELEDIFRDMAPPFEGKESEGNWLARDKNVLKLRRITKGNAPSEFHGAFVTGIKSLLDGILKVANSLRTTMSTNGCELIQELAKTLGPAMDPWTEILLQNCIKMCAATKQIAAKNGNITVDAIFSNVSYSSRLLQHVSFASQDKNVQPREFSMAWLKTLIRKHKSQIEHSGGLDVVDKTLKRGLADANPKVRERSRAAFWMFAQIWPQRSEAILATLDPKSKGLLEKDPNNPNASLASSQTSSVASFSKSVGAASGPTSRLALREKIAEEKKAKLAAAKQLPERPTSAQATFSPVKPQSAAPLGSRAPLSSTTTAHSARPPSAMSSVASARSAFASSNVNGSGSLMSGTVRRPQKPKLARPATADPYASRHGVKTVTPSMTPEKTPARETAKKPVAPKSTSRPRTATGQSPSVSPVRSKSRLDQLATHRKTPSADSVHSAHSAHSVNTRISSPAASPSRNEELTMVLPYGKLPGHEELTAMPFRRKPVMDKTMSVDSGAPYITGDEGFTMVIPSMQFPHPSAQPSAQRSPPKPSSTRLDHGNPRTAGDLTSGIPLLPARSPRIRSPDRSLVQSGDASASYEDEVQVYEDPFVGEELGALATDAEKPVLEELPLNEKNLERRLSGTSVESNTITGDNVARPEEISRDHHKTTSTSSIMATDNNDAQPTQDRAEVLRNRRLLVSGIDRIRAKTLDAHGFRRLQDLVKGNQEIWGANDEKFGELLLGLLDYLEAPNETLKAPPGKAANLKVQVLATIRAMLAMYRKETAVYYSRALCAILQTRSHYDSASHIATDLESTADEIVRYGQISDCLNAVLDLIESTSPAYTRNIPSSPSATSSDGSDAPRPKSPAPVANRTTTMGLSVLAQLLQVAHAKNVPITNVQTQRLGQLAVRFLDDTDPDVRKADLEFCIALHERIGGEKDVFWKAVAGAREQHLNLITYFLARRGKA
ncbi:protein STU1 [Lepidopterella palustris CBS 459.81]|uniref:Protein STU1 n=1 Tax=Lepidopterella palustris CBS 459.81 TaxID=1314670 RepID=A0A8E2JKQ5_9PEZI|nr:protein STU1 [Lepidopterella palustris CBS 459.81]